MRRIIALLIAACLVLMGAGKSTPSGHFELSPGPYIAGGDITFTVTDLAGVNNNYEVTLGVWCDPPIAWGSPAHNPWIYEFNSFGKVLIGYPLVLHLPSAGNCTSRLIAALWRKGQPIQAWFLDEHAFTVDP